MPLAPPGIKIEMHEKPKNRPSFGYQSTSSFYIGPAMNHYRCYKVYIPTTSSEQVTDTIDFSPLDFECQHHLLWTKPSKPPKIQ